MANVPTMFRGSESHTGSTPLKAAFGSLTVARLRVTCLANAAPAAVAITVIPETLLFPARRNFPCGVSRSLLTAKGNMSDLPDSRGNSREGDFAFGFTLVGSSFGRICRSQWLRQTGLANH